MYRIRHYTDTIHPDQFKRSGWLGFWIVCLNWVRWRLEVYVQSLVVRWTVKAGSLPKSRGAELMRTFRLDAKAEELEKEKTSPLHEPAQSPEFGEDHPATRAERYVQGRKSNVLELAAHEESGLPNRPKPMDNLIGQYAFNARAKKYARGRRYLVLNGEGDFEPVEEDAAHGRRDVAGGGDRSSVGGRVHGGSGRYVDLVDKISASRGHGAGGQEQGGRRGTGA